MFISLGLGPNVPPDTDKYIHYFEKGVKNCFDLKSIQGQRQIKGIDNKATCYMIPAKSAADY